jgi:hypothetical protein
MFTSGLLQSAAAHRASGLPPNPAAAELSRIGIRAMGVMVEDFRRWRLWFPLGWVLIAAVSVYDIWLTVRYREEMPLLEENPLGIWLIRLDSGDINLFVQLKIAGTIVVMAVLLRMMLRESRLLAPVTGTLASLQTGLLLYLTLV